MELIYYRGTGIGAIEKLDTKSWYWTCFEKGKEYEYEPFSSGCATTKKDARAFVVDEWKAQRG